ncbi:dTDP-4-dehydrorhamnose reductase [Thermodesulfobacteriota bacterium]
MKKNSILVVGAKGQLGWELIRQGEAFDGDVVGVDVDELDITHQSAVQAYFNQQMFSIVINAAAYTAVDQAEKESKIVFSVNRDGPRNLALACNEKSIPLVHISTDYVFDGLKSSPYREDDLPSPVGVYAHSKAEGELWVVKAARRHIIVRTAWLYGVHANNFVKTMLRLGREKTDLRVVNDQYGCPTSAAALAAAILIICRKILTSDNLNAWGVYHYCDAGETTWYGFAGKIFDIAVNYEILAFQKLVPITTKEYSTPAKRPHNSVLSCEKIQRIFNIQRKPWEENLEEVMQRLYGAKD